MKENWILETGGKPLETVHNFIAQVWGKADLNSMLVPIKSSADGLWRPQVVQSPERVRESNPFTPVMVENTARMVPDYIKDNPGNKIGAILRPCEMGSLIEMVKHNGIDLSNLLTISMDCLGTFPSEEFTWRAERKGSAEHLTEETVRFSRQGGIVPYRFRAACQLCDLTMAESADINIGIIGLPIRQNILVTTVNGMGKTISFENITNGKASTDLVDQHQEIGTKMNYRRKATRERLAIALAEQAALDIESLAEQLMECGDCQECMNACPICDVFKPQKAVDGSYPQETLKRWLVSCVGCGMCEDKCPASKPLSAIFTIVRDQILEANPYRPGISLDDPLPTFH